MMNNNEVKGMVFDIQHFAVSDGPGIRTVVFFKGCPLRCTWCHNPEAYIARPQVMFYKEKCLQCGKCAALCPEGLQSCRGCGACTAACAAGAREMAGRMMTAEDVLQEVLQDEMFYLTSGGGVTLSGGEPMAQFPFALALAKSAKEHGLHVCMETSGYCPPEHIMAILPYVDLFLYDYKVTEEADHVRHTGVGRQRIMENLRLIDAHGGKTVLRCPMIPGVNVTQAHVQGIMHTAQSLRNLVEINLEPYHNIGLSKRERLGMAAYEEIAPPEKAILSAMAEEIERETGCKTRVM